MHLAKARGNDDYILTEFLAEVPPYAILSHTWDAHEINFQALKESIGAEKIGRQWMKLRFCAQQSARDNIEYFWVDTCCIDKTNNAILSEALNSMFRWYKEAQRCYVYLSDVDEGPDWVTQFRASRWFTRGWTLQELVAPLSVQFFSKNGKVLGDKSSLEKLIHEITGIAITALRGQPMSTFSTEQRMNWTNKRETSRPEDMAYCLFGIFDVFLPVIYGEGKMSAMGRLQNEIISSIDKVRAEISSWLSPLDFDARYEELYRQWTPDTCDWFLKTAEFLTWKGRESHSFSLVNNQGLWCSGPQGTGKSIICSRVVRRLKDELTDHGGRFDAVLCLFCSHDAHELQNSIHLIGSLLRQIVNLPGRPLSFSIRKSFEEAKASGTQSATKRLSLQVLLSLLIKEIRSFNTVYIIVDALDECANDDGKGGSPRNELLSTLLGLLEDNDPNVKVLLTTRPDPESHQACLWPKVDISAPDTDIHLFVDQQIKAQRRIQKMNLVELIKEKITANAHGMFLLASLHWREVSSSLSKGELRQKLDRLPQSLQGHYEKSLKRIYKQPTNIKSLAETILAWVYRAIRPLRIQELQHVLVLASSNSTSFNDDWLIDHDQIISFCIGLVVIGDGGIIRFSHFTVKEYFDLASQDGCIISLDNADKDIALICLRYLTLDEFGEVADSETSMKSRMDHMSLLRYAARYWHRHAYKPDDDSPSSHELRECLTKLFLGKEKSFYLNWLRVDNPNPKQNWLGECPWLGYDDLPSSTLLTGLLGLEELNAKIPATQEARSNHLLAEVTGHVYSNHLSEVRSMLDRGIGSNFKDDKDEPLLMACNSVEMMSLILCEGADPNATSPRGWNALQCAARHGRLDMVKLLHQKGANIPPAPGQESALHHAVYFGNYDTAAYLLENGAARDINAEGEVGPLPHWAAAHGQLRILQLLVEYGADLNKVWHYGNVGASVLEWLMGEGFRYAVQGKLAGWGMGSEHQQVALYLLDNRIATDLVRNARNRYGETLLHWATRREFEDVVKMAIQRGVDKTIRCRDAENRLPNPTALEIAESISNQVIIDMLK